MDFGAYIRKPTFSEMIDQSKLAEELGYYGVFINDHVIGFADEGFESYLEAWTVMTGIGLLTSKIRIGHIVLFNSLRNPAFLAKSVSTLDSMIGGRYDLLIGAGWNSQEYEGYDLMENGSGMPSAKERVDRLEESLQILRMMLSQESTDFNGKFWTLKGAINLPQPIQKPMKIIVGGQGARMMRISALHADGMNLSERHIPTMLSLIRKFEKEANLIGKSLEDYTMSGFAGVYLGRNEVEINDHLNQLSKRMKLSRSEIREGYLIGTNEEIIEKLRLLEDNHIKMMVIAPVLHKTNVNRDLQYFNDEIINQI